uniref:Uncharacterized protein n=1 Tax=Quercus lobata TaxID=97700 RepID=A0A7N2MNN0_QUELO
MMQLWKQTDGKTFISTDDLRINLWNIEISNQCFSIIDMKPSNMEDLTVVAFGFGSKFKFDGLDAVTFSLGMINILN